MKIQLHVMKRGWCVGHATFMDSNFSISSHFIYSFIYLFVLDIGVRLRARWKMGNTLINIRKSQSSELKEWETAHQSRMMATNLLLDLSETASDLTMSKWRLMKRRGKPWRHDAHWLMPKTSWSSIFCRQRISSSSSACPSCSLVLPSPRLVLLRLGLLSDAEETHGDEENSNRLTQERSKRNHVYR